MNIYIYIFTIVMLLFLPVSILNACISRLLSGGRVSLIFAETSLNDMSSWMCAISPLPPACGGLDGLL